MPQQATIKVQVDGKDLEIPLPEGVVLEADVKSKYMPKAAFETELARRSDSIIQTKLNQERERLLEDEEFRGLAVEKWGIKGKEQELEKKTQDTLQSARQDWEKKFLSPVQTRLQERETTIKELLNDKLTTKILLAAREVGVKDPLLARPAEGQNPMIVNMLANAFGYDEKTREFYVKKGDTFDWSSSPTDAVPYKTVTEFMKEWVGKKENELFVTDQRQRGPGAQSSPGAVRGKDIVLTREQAKDVREYARAKEAAAKQGGEVIIQQQ